MEKFLDIVYVGALLEGAHQYQLDDIFGVVAALWTTWSHFAFFEARVNMDNLRGLPQRILLFTHCLAVLIMGGTASDLNRDENQVQSEEEEYQ